MLKKEPPPPRNVKNKAPQELLYLSLKLKGLSHLLENQNAEGISPDEEAYWGLALLLKDMSRKAERIRQGLEKGKNGSHF